MTERKMTEQECWEEGYSVYWSIGPFYCQLSPHHPDQSKAFVNIEWNNGKVSEHPYADHADALIVDRTITVAEAKRQSAEYCLRELANWLAEADTVRTGNGNGRSLVHIALRSRAASLGELATTPNAENSGMATEFRQAARQTAELSPILRELTCMSSSLTYD